MQIIVTPSFENDFVCSYVNRRECPGRAEVGSVCVAAVADNATVRNVLVESVRAAGALASYDCAHAPDHLMQSQAIP